MGTLWAPMWVPYGAPTFQKINQLILVLVPAPSNQETTCYVGGEEVGGHDVATTCHLQTHPHTLARDPLNVGLNYRDPQSAHIIFFFFFEEPYGLR